jgi:1,4-dihydroxy-2-naphthoate octaprenyltransferase
VRRLRAFITLARLPFLFGGFAGFALGAAVARHDGYALDWRAYVWGQILVTAFHLMVHFANDYFDQASDALTTRTAWSGGSGVLAANELPPWVALAAAFGCVAIGFAALARIAVGGNLALVLVGCKPENARWSYAGAWRTRRSPRARLRAGRCASCCCSAVRSSIRRRSRISRSFRPHSSPADTPCRI